MSTSRNRADLAASGGFSGGSARESAKRGQATPLSQSPANRSPRSPRPPARRLARRLRPARAMRPRTSIPGVSLYSESDFCEATKYQRSPFLMFMLVLITFAYQKAAGLLILAFRRLYQGPQSNDLPPPRFCGPPSSVVSVFISVANYSFRGI